MFTWTYARFPYIYLDLTSNYLPRATPLGKNHWLPRAKFFNFLSLPCFTVNDRKEIFLQSMTKQLSIRSSNPKLATISLWRKATTCFLWTFRVKDLKIWSVTALFWLKIFAKVEISWVILDYLFFLSQTIRQFWIKKNNQHLN